MALTTLDEKTALVVIDLQKGIATLPTQLYTSAEMITRTAELANEFRAHGTDLDLHLRHRGITQIVLTGIATSIGVESTARAAYEHGYHVTLATDAMSDLDGTSHRHSIEKIFPRLGETGTTEEILELFAKTR